MLKKIVLLITVFTLSLSMSSCALFRSAEESEDTPTETEKSTQAAAAQTAPETEEVLPVIPAPEPGAPKTICIDAGHGYDDPGCTTDYLNGQYEREIAAEYAESLKAELESRGYRVVMLHTPDKYVTAAEVAEEADKVGLDYKPDKLVDDGRFAAYNRTVWLNVLHRYTYIDAFVSLHIDTFTEDESVRGTRIYYCSENGYSEESAELCASMTESLGAALPEQNTRYFAKTNEEAYIVTKYSQMPSALIEMGFATNPTDAANILNDDWQTKFVTATADGIAEFVGE